MEVARGVFEAEVVDPLKGSAVVLSVDINECIVARDLKVHDNLGTVTNTKMNFRDRVNKVRGS